MDLKVLDQLGHRLADTTIDMRAIYSDDATLAYNFCTQWSNFPQCQTPKWSYPRTGTLLGLSEVTTVVRRLLANKMCFLPEFQSTADGVQNPILRLACQHPGLVRPDSPRLIEAAQCLWTSSKSSYHVEPSFEQILHHSIMRDFWTQPRIRLYQRRMLLTPQKCPAETPRMTMPFYD
ncbi:hypothetical protein F5X97DRAFT_323503 [Nemania serpens]|nr:hypothetical protein F5X97DRAFT_323503 [Nemania serpens]